jgi:hypothetical protein
MKSYCCPDSCILDAEQDHIAVETVLEAKDEKYYITLQ